MIEIQPIRSEADYKAALVTVSRLFDNQPEPGSEDEARFDAVCTLIEAYERKHYPISPPDPIEAIKFCMEQQGLSPKDLQPMIGGLNRVYEVLARKRPLTMPMIRRLHQQLGIPAESLIGV